MTDKKVSIRHKPGTYKVYRNLSNKPWYALAEFVDNALQSFESNEPEIKRIDGDKLVCKIDITIEAGREIVIRDNAGGISEKEFRSGFRASKQA
jgi:hypothetical protein